MNDSIRTFFLSSLTLGRNLDGIDHELSVTLPPGGGAPVNWVLGHIINTRSHLLKMLGAEPIWGEGEAGVYGKGADPAAVASDFMPLAELVAVFEDSGGKLEAALSGASAEKLAEPLDGSHPILGETVAQAVVGLAFHEAYHMGQIGTIRRALGLSGAI